MVSVRKLSPQEWPLYRALRLEALKTEPHAFAAGYESNAARPDEYWQGRLQDAQADPRRTLLFAFDGEEAIGMVGAYPNEEGETEVIAMFVRREARGRGVGRLLMSTVLEELGGSAILDVREAQTSAVALYRACGFEVEREDDAPHPDGSTHRLLRMRRQAPGTRG